MSLPVTFVVFFTGVAGPNAARGGERCAARLRAAGGLARNDGDDPRPSRRLVARVGGRHVGRAHDHPRPPPDRLRAAAAGCAGALASVLRETLRGPPSEEQLAGALATKHELLAAFTASPSRPTGLGAPEQAFANAVEMLEWCTGLVDDMVKERPDLSAAEGSERDLLQRAGEVLENVEGLFRGSAVQPDLEGLAEARDRSLERLGARPNASPGGPAAARLAFHAHMIAVATLALASDALVAERREAPAWLERQRRVWYERSRAARRARRRVAALASVAVQHASVRSVWLVSSVRGAVAISTAVAVADLATLEHGFWVVLGTLSVLRSNAVSTGATALRALAGTVIGFVIGGALLIVIGAESAALWIVLPLAVLVAAYTPGTAPFEVGQAAFTVTIAVLFNLLIPVGWKVGVVRIEDVAIGCGVSVIVGLLFWPRGLAAVVGDDLADAYRSGAYYLTQAVQWATRTQGEAPDGAANAFAAAGRLDEGLRGFLAERGSKRVALQQLWRLVGGSMRLRLTAYSIADLPKDGALSGSAQAALARRVATLAAWFERLAEELGGRSAVPVASLAAPTFAPSEVVRAGEGTDFAVWLCEHLDHLAEHLGELAEPAVRVAELRRRPWWR